MNFLDNIHDKVNTKETAILPAQTHLFPASLSKARKNFSANQLFTMRI